MRVHPVPLRRPSRARSASPYDGSISDTDAVLDVNQRYYDAFEAGDLDAMSELWDHGDGVVCTHPGWGSLRGWASISASYFALFQGGSQLQFILTGAHARVAGDVAWVSLDENLLGTDVGGTAAALNVFLRTPDGWRMVVHHASPVAASAPGGGD